ncbi:MAG: hypothetical protein JNJ54_37455 [Myxococcaceae bacterium]|nr:hypothetical protein [Myxococcaceae bacterium]
MRRSLLVLAASVAVAGPAAADCRSSWVKTFPGPEVTLPTQGRVLLTLGGSLEKVDVAATVRFVSEQRRERVAVVSSFSGFNQRLVVLSPEKPLAPGTWDLVLLQAPRGLEPKLGRWTVADASDTTAPSLTATPRAGPTSWKAYGCGPASLVPIEGVATNEVALLEVLLTRPGAPPATAVLAPHDGALELGHGMCGGQFSLAPGTKATVVLTPIDLAGNRGASSQPIEVVAPGPGL